LALKIKRHILPFSNPHLRTNSFFISLSEQQSRQSFFYGSP
jgi:hypothetical protein